MNQNKVQEEPFHTIAPDDLEHLIEQVFNGIMKLPEETRNQIHKKYLERYGWYVK